MKAIVWILVPAAVSLAVFGIIQSRNPVVPAAPLPAAVAQIATPAKDAKIASYLVANDGAGALRISYEDGAIAEIPRERGRFTIGDVAVVQESFSSIRIADDRRHIGWVAVYNNLALCFQTYACSLEVVIFQAGKEPRYIAPGTGVIWQWYFVGGGREVVVHSGRSHGDDTGLYTLWDSDNGMQHGEYVPGEATAPDWVRSNSGTDPN